MLSVKEFHLRLYINDETGQDKKRGSTIYPAGFGTAYSQCLLNQFLYIYI